MQFDTKGEMMDPKLKKLYSPFWVVITAVLSVVFIILFYPIAHRKLGFPLSAVVTLLAVFLIWLNYLIRAIMFTYSKSEPPANNTVK